MRIIAGKWRSRRLNWPKGGTTRPMPDRLRESLFSILGSRYDTPGELPPVRVADVFAGSGSMGLEALSRGAAACTFFERDRGAVAVLRSNLEALGAGDEAAIISRDAWVASITREGDPPWDLVFLDPPYRDCADVSADGTVRKYLARLAERVRADVVVVLHHPHRSMFDPTPEGWRVDDHRIFGTHAISLLTR